MATKEIEELTAAFKYIAHALQEQAKEIEILKAVVAEKAGKLGWLEADSNVNLGRIYELNEQVAELTKRIERIEEPNYAGRLERV